MRFYLNEASLQGQFDDETAFRPLLEALLAARARSPLLAAMRTTPALAERPVSHARNLREVVQGWRGSPIAGVMLAWVGRNGPFIHEDRLPDDEDFFHCLGVDVTDGGLGEACRRVKACEAVATMSFPGGTPDFARSPLPVAHGCEEEPIFTYSVDNFWEAEAAVAAALARDEPARSWQAMVQAARARFRTLILPDTIWKDQRLACEPFDPIIRDRFYVLLSYLDVYMRDRNADGSEGRAAREVVRIHFKGDRALFSPESLTNRNNFRADMTFDDPDGGAAIFAHWHGKISHRFFRLHFEWPVPATEERLKILYIGPKLTKS